MPLNAGDLTERVTIETPTQTRNIEGEVVTSWSTFAEVWANVSALPSRSVEKYFDVLGAVALMAYAVKIRAVPGITTAMRVIYRGRTLEIGSINEYERVWYLELVCVETKPVTA
jgi:SPP1 family predicted phage head-tail adaptor